MFSPLEEAPAITGQGPSVECLGSAFFRVKGLHVILLAIEELHTLVNGRASTSQFVVGGPSLEQRFVSLK